MLAVIRATGKRTIGNFTAFDLLVALMLGDLVDEIIYGDVLQPWAKPVQKCDLDRGEKRKAS